MQSLHSLSLAPAVNAWLANSRQPRILHIFDRACNLINERREVLSIVTPQIGNGPFNLVLEEDILFSEHLSLQSPVSFSATQLHLGDLTIPTANARLWDPHPDWEKLRVERDDISTLFRTRYGECGLDTVFTPIVQGGSTAITQSLVSSFSLALVQADILATQEVTPHLAGAGIGLTPSGDDFLLGALLAAWIIHPPEIASVLAKKIASTAAPLTTSLSAAWLRAAGKGEAGIVWHEFLNTLTGADPAQIQMTMDKILAVGETSGADALAGFIGTVISYAQRETKSCHS